MRTRGITAAYEEQRKLLETFAARACAVRKVVTNSGGKTAGVDNTTWNCPEDYYKAVERLKQIVLQPRRYRAQPLRRVMIPKNKKGDMRPLGIPTIEDRAVQALYHLVVDPIVEYQSDPNSYGFRKGRSTQQAAFAAWNHLNKRKSPE